MYFLITEFLVFDGNGIWFSHYWKPLVSISFSNRLVLPTSVGDLDMMLSNLVILSTAFFNYGTPVGSLILLACSIMIETKLGHMTSTYSFDTHRFSLSMDSCVTHTKANSAQAEAVAGNLKYVFQAT